MIGLFRRKSLPLECFALDDFFYFVKTRESNTLCPVLIYCIRLILWNNDCSNIRRNIYNILLPPGYICVNIRRIK